MTPLMMQDALIKALREALADLRPGGKPFRFYAQCLPPRKEAKDRSIFPFCRVELRDGEDGDESFQETALVFCVLDDSETIQGHRDLMNAIQRTRARFRRDPVFAGRYVVQGKIEWELPAEDHFPYFFGGVYLRVQIPGITLLTDDL